MTMPKRYTFDPKTGEGLWQDVNPETGEATPDAAGDAAREAERDRERRQVNPGGYL